MVSLFLLRGCNLSCIVDLFPALHELAVRELETLGIHLNFLLSIALVTKCDRQQVKKNYLTAVVFDPMRPGFCSPSMMSYRLSYKARREQVVGNLYCNSRQEDVKGTVLFIEEEQLYTVNHFISF